MALQDQDAGIEWVGKTVLGRDGTQIGVCSAVIADDSTGLPEWLCVDLDLMVWVPATDAVRSGEQVRVTVTEAEVTSAPPTVERPPSEDEKAALRRHYAIEAFPAAAHRPRWLVVLAGVLSGAGAVAAVVLAVRRLRARQERTRRPAIGVDRLARRASALAYRVPAVAAPATAAVRSAATRSGRRAAELAAAAGQTGAAAGATAGRAGVAAGRSAGIRAAQLAAAGTALAAAAGSSGARSGRRVGEAVGAVPEAVSERSDQLQKQGRKVMGKVTAVLALGVGYVLGTRAGRPRYEQLKQTATKVGQRPEMQQAQERIKAVAGDKLQKGTEQGKRLAATAKHRAASAKQRGSRTSTDPATDPGADPYAAAGTGTPGGPLPQAGLASDPLSPVDPLPDPALGDDSRGR